MGRQSLIHRVGVFWGSRQPFAVLKWADETRIQTVRFLNWSLSKMPEQNSAKATSAPQRSEDFGPVPQDSERFGAVPKASEAFRTPPQYSERKDNHTVTVREAARMFEAAGVARTERSIVNWCQPNKLGVPRLDCYFDPNEGKYYITPESIQLAISEEMAKARRVDGTSGNASSNRPGSQAEGQMPTQGGGQDTSGRGNSEDLRTLKQEILDLKITNKGKDYFIEQLQKERESFNRERQEYVEKLMNFNRQVGELEAKVFQLEQPSERRLHVHSVPDLSESAN